MNQIRLMLVDDEDDFRIPIATILRNSDMEVIEASSPTQMDSLLQQFAPDVMVLDINLPGESGFDIAKRLKQTHNFRIIMLTAYGDIDDRVKGLGRGADYYLTKPVETRELLAVIKNLYNRNHDSDNTSAKWKLNTSEWTLTTPDQLIHELTKSEFQIVKVLSNHQGEPIYRKQLYSELGMSDYAPETRSLDIQISRLRRRFTTDEYTIPIKTVHSIGYLFSDKIIVLE